MGERAITDEIVERLKKARRTLVAAHYNPEGDAIGATLAVTLLLDKLGGQAAAYNRDGVPCNNKFLPFSERISAELPPWTPDTVVVVDCGDFKRVGDEAKKRMESAPSIINIDHHETNSRFGSVNWVAPESASASEMVIELVDAFGEDFWSPEIATALYTGILADTGSFQFNNTSPDCLRQAARMVEKGADPSEVAYRLFADVPLARLKLLALALSTLEAHHDGKISSMEVTREMFDKTGAGAEDTEGFIDFARSVSGVRAAVLFREDGPEEYKISLRAPGDFDVAAIARQYGGGGHRAAAGCSVKGSLEQVKSDVINRLKESLTATVE